MEVLDLLLTFQFNTRLESFIAKFKMAEMTANIKKTKQQSVVAPLLVENYDPFDQSKWAIHTSVHIWGFQPVSFSLLFGHIVREIAKLHWTQCSVQLV